jgi:hypothetical protein
MASRDRPSIHLRLPRDLHDELRARADAQDISFNTLLATLLAGSIGWTLDLSKKTAYPSTWMPEHSLDPGANVGTDSTARAPLDHEEGG